MTKQPLLEVRDLHKIYDSGVYALKGVSFSVYEGEFLGIIGLSGSGKSTLLRCLNRLIEPTSGEIFLNGENITKLHYNELRHKRREIAMVFQHFNLIKRRSVLSNVLSGRLGSTTTVKSILNVFSDEDKKDARQKLKVVGLEEKSHVRAEELSGGQQQRVAIARALMQQPKLLLADEPVASLDPATSHSVMDYLEKANKEMGKTILCNLHFLSLVRRYTTRVIALKGGEVVYEGGSSEIDEKWFKRIYGEEAREVEIR
jgi:phosphonate transport system ATP-binding protein